VSTFQVEPLSRPLSNDEILDLLRRGEITVQEAFELQNRRIESELGVDVEAEAQRFTERIAGAPESPSFDDLIADLADVSEFDPLLAQIEQENIIRRTSDAALPFSEPDTSPRPTMAGFADLLVRQPSSRFEQAVTSQRPSDDLRFGPTPEAPILFTNEELDRFRAERIERIKAKNNLVTFNRTGSTLPLDQMELFGQQLSEMSETELEELERATEEALREQSVQNVRDIPGAEFGLEVARGASVGLSDPILEAISGQAVPTPPEPTGSIAGDLLLSTPHLIGMALGAPGRVAAAGAGLARGTVGRSALGLGGFEALDIAREGIVEGDLVGTAGRGASTLALGAGFGVAGKGLAILFRRVRALRAKNPQAADQVEAGLKDLEQVTDPATRQRVTAELDELLTRAENQVAEEALQIAPQRALRPRQATQATGAVSEAPKPAKALQPAEAAEGVLDLGGKPQPAKLPEGLRRATARAASPTATEAVQAPGVSANELLQHARKVTGRPNLTLEEMQNLPGEVQAEIVNTLPRTPSVQPQEVTGAGAPPSRAPVPQTGVTGEAAGRQALEGQVRKALGATPSGAPGGAGFMSGGGIDFSVGKAAEALKKADVAIGEKLGTDAPASAAKRAIDAYATQMTDLIGREGGAVGKVIREKARRANTLNREVQERLAKHSIEVQEELSARPHRLLSKKQRMTQKARKDLQKFEPGEVESDALYSRGRILVEDLSQKPGNAEEAKIIGRIRQWLRESGEVAQDFNVQRLVGGEVQAFQRALKENKLPRLATTDLLRMAQKGGEEFRRLAEILANENGISFQKSLESLKELYGPDSTRVLGMFERARVFEKFPDAMKFKGRTIQLLETDPVRMMTAGTQTIAARLSFLRVFGQEFAETAPVTAGGQGRAITRLEKLRQRYVNAGARHKDFNDLVKLLNNRPINLLLEEGVAQRGLLGKAVVDIANPIYQALALSRTAIVNIPETIGALRAQAGTFRLIRSLLSIARNPIKRRNDLLNMGAINKKLLDFFVRPNYKTHDIGSIVREGGIKMTGVSFFNELNELVAGEAGRRMALELLARGRLGKKISLNSIQALENLGFRKRFIDRIEKGKISAGSKEEATVIREVSARTSGFTQGSGTLTRAERSALANTPWFRFALDFQTYNQTIVNRYGVLGRRLAKAVANGDAKGTAIAIKRLADQLVGTAAAGAAATWLGAIAMGRVADFGDGGWDSFWRQVLQGGIAGPLRGFEFADPEKQGLLETVGGLVPKVRPAVNIFDLIYDRGRFADKVGIGENTLELFKAQVPIAKTAGLYLTLAGQQDPKIIDASRRYWRWRKKNDIKSFGEKDPGDNLFRKAKTELGRAIANGQQEAAHAALVRALAAGMVDQAELDRLALGKRSERDLFLKSAQRIRNSLRAKRLLPRLSKLHQQQIRKDLPPEVIRQLEIHDELIEVFLSTVSLQKAAQAVARQRRKAG
jgi:hypothetical protein